MSSIKKGLRKHKIAAHIMSLLLIPVVADLIDREVTKWKRQFEEEDWVVYEKVHQITTTIA